MTADTKEVAAASTVYSTISGTVRRSTVGMEAVGDLCRVERDKRGKGKGVNPTTNYVVLL